MKKVQLLSFQKEFILSTAKKALFLAGIGTGKSFSGSHFVLNMIAKHPNSNGLITANTYTQLMNATVVVFIGELEDLGIPYTKVMGGPNKHIQVYNVKIFLYSLERPDTIRGIEVGWWWSDESGFSKIEAIQICRGRLRDKRGPLYERHTSSPNSFNWLYDEFENKDGARKTKAVSLFRGRTCDNIFLPDGYYLSLLEDYGGKDNPLAKQELFGQFTNLQAGAVYWAFNRDIHVQPCKLDEAFPVFAGQDFNIDNMAGCYVQYRDGTFYVTKENILDHYGANTDSAASVICKDLLPKYRVSLIPDSTGKARKTSASGRTDHEIMRSYGLDIPRGVRNPFIRDRQNTLNNHMKKNNLIIDPSCKELIKEMETLSSRDKEGDKAHVSVSLGYVTYFVSPLITRRKSTFR